MMDSHEFLLKHSQEWSEKYPGKCIAIVGDELVAIGHNELEVFKEAKMKYPDGDLYCLPANRRRSGDVVMKYPYIQFRNRFLPIIPIRFRIGKKEDTIYTAYQDNELMGWFK